MNRRELIQRGGLTVGLLAVGGPLTLMQIGCGSTGQMVRWTSTFIGALKDITPILGDMGAGNVVSLIARAVPIAEKLKKAFEDNNHADTLTFLDNLINPQTGIIAEIADAVGALADDNRKRIVLGSLAIGMVALRLISANIENEVPASGAAVARKGQPRAAAAVSNAAQGSALERAFAAVRF
jgi:hypothetical protein